MSEALKPMQAFGMLVSAIKCGEPFTEAHEKAADVLRAALAPAEVGDGAKCKRCDGAGTITGYESFGPDTYSADVNCPFCHGTGWHPSDDEAIAAWNTRAALSDTGEDAKCETCHGTGASPFRDAGFPIRCPDCNPDPTAAVVGSMDHIVDANKMIGGSMVEPADDDDPVVEIGRIGNELHNHSLRYQDDGDEYEFLSDVAVRLWASQNQIRSRIADLERQLSEARAEVKQAGVKALHAFGDKLWAEAKEMTDIRDEKCTKRASSQAHEEAARLQEEG